MAEGNAESINESCENCKFWRPVSEGHPAIKSHYCEPGEAGDCRRYPPVMLQESEIDWEAADAFFLSPMGWFHPCTDQEYWCGEYQRKAVAKLPL